MHGNLDIALREEENRIRTGQVAHNMTVLRRLALHLLRQAPMVRGGLAANRKQAGWQEASLLPGVVAIAVHA